MNTSVDNEVEKYPTSKVITIDVALSLVASKRFYQYFIGGFVCLIIAPFNAFNLVTQYLIILEPEHSCKFDPSDILSANLSINASDFKPYISPIRFDLELTRTCEIESINNTVLECQNGHEYDYSFIYSTPVSENNWICSESWKAYFTHSAYWTGSLIGVLVLGYIADKYGRVPALIWCHIIPGLTGILSILLSSNFVLFVILRCLNGVCVHAQHTIGLILAMEYVGSKSRVLISNIFLISYALAAGLLPWLAYYVEDWKNLLLITSIPPLLTPLCFFFVPESIRWYASKRKVEEIKRTLIKLAKLNGRQISDVSLEHIKLPPTNRSISIQMIFKYKRFTRHFLIINLMWFFQCIGYIGGNIYASSTCKNPFLMLSIIAILDVFAAFLSSYCSCSFGRKSGSIGTSLLATALYISACFVPESCIYTNLAVLFLGRLFFSAAYNILYLYITEIYPTMLRSRGAALTFAVGSIGAVISPQLISLSKYSKIIPLAVFGSVGLISIFLLIWLPETKDKPLPSNLEEANKFSLKIKTKLKDLKAKVEK